MSFGALIIFAAIAIIISVILQVKSNAKKVAARGENLNRILQNISDIQPTRKVIGFNYSYIFAVDEIAKKVLLLTETSKRVIDYADIISVELQEDSSVVAKKSTIRTIGGAVAGGVLAGGTGAVIGGLSGSSKQQKKVSSVKIKILLKSISNPSFFITCFDAQNMTTERKKELSPDSMEGYIYKDCFNRANEIKDIVSVIIDLVDSEEEVSARSIAPPVGSVNVADELSKLAELKDKGILTEAEFCMQKKKLLV